MNQMGNLEKLGILVIVILVVVVGVVAITPKEQVDSALFTPEDTSGLNGAPEPLERPGDAPADLVQPGGESLGDGASTNPKDWPLPPSGAKSLDLPARANEPRTDVLGGDRPIGTLPLEQKPAVADPQPTEYVVQKGDTGASISKKLLGRATAWNEIVALNPGLDARKLKINQKIKVPAAKSATATIVPTPSAQLPAGQPGMTPPGGTAVLPAPQEPVTPTPAPAADNVYVVQSGDTLSDIARRELGSASKWKLILDANSAVLHGSEVVRVGMKLTIPAAARTASLPKPQSPGAIGPAADSGKTYKVRAGDTLTSIASRMLGSGARWREIQKANESVLHGSDRLTVGMDLLIPENVAAR